MQLDNVSTSTTGASRQVSAPSEDSQFAAAPEILNSLKQRVTRTTYLRGARITNTQADPVDDDVSANLRRNNSSRREEWEQVSMVPLQTWEGYVTSVIPEERRFTADLHDKAALAQSYSAEISLTEIDPEDLDLVKEGAVFYWTFGKVNVSRGSPVNYDQIRFRRLPNWTKTRLETATRKATELYDFFKDAE
ncbi:hypothetical protein [Paraburkholderia sediminicola]|uniref:hypothetical protein n=1 Tax=Paraburkholderia sediminicola TaxID=458836 RepID=UPI0038BD5A38